MKSRRFHLFGVSTLLPYFDLAVFVETPTDVRVARLAAREATRFGANACAPGGWRHAEATEFVDWASHYEDGTREGRSRVRHEAFANQLTCRVLRVDGTRATSENIARISAEIGAPG